MKICYFGDYDAHYARNRVIIRGLQENGVTVFHCDNHNRGFAKFVNLIKLHSNIKNKYDLMIVGYSDSRSMVLLAKFLTSRLIIWDAFYSLYDAYVHDRKIIKPLSIKALYYWILDWINCILSDKILLDTNEHIRYFEKTFGIKKEKFIKVLIGADDTIFHPPL